MLEQAVESTHRKRKQEEELVTRTASRPRPTILHATQHILEGATNFKIENSTLTNVQGNATIFKFDDDSFLTEEFKSVILQHLTGSVTVQDLDKVKKAILSQSIRNIPRANAAYNDYTLRNRKRVACFEGTRRALLLEIGEWAVDPNGALCYVLFGIAGVGKSTVAQTFAEKADVLRLLGASFFFSRDEVDRRNAAKFFTTIAFQLCIFNERFAQAIGHVLSQDEGIAAMSKEPHEQLNVLILEPLRSIVKPGPLPILVIVDALDECDEQDREVVITELNRLVRELPSFKVFLTTRPHPYLEDIVKSGNPHKVFRLEDIEKKVVDSDIRVYLKHSLSHEEVSRCLRGLSQPWSASDNDIEFLVQAAGQLFIVASTSVRFILDTKARTPGFRMQALLDASGQGRTPLKALNDFYTVMLRCAVPKDCDKDILGNYQAVVGAIIVIRIPLLIESFSELIGVSEERTSAVLDNLQSVIYLGKNDNMPRIYHKSFSDFIADSDCCQDGDLRIVARDHHTRLAICCLRVMNRRLKRNILGLGVPAQYLDNDQALEEERISKDQLSKMISADLRYACVYWATHVKEADIKNSHLVEELKSFADNHLLHWFEVLSWVRQLGIAHSALGIVVDLLKSASDDMGATFYDALRCVSMSFSYIHCSALHTYHSALPFTPTKRPLLEKYKKQMTHIVVGGREEWDAEITTLNPGGRVIHMMFSSDSSQLASLARLLNHSKVTVSDTTSGIPLTTLNDATIALAGDFSVAASSQGSTVMLRSVASNAPLATFQHPKNVVALAVSFDGSRLAAALDGGAIFLWDVGKEVAIATPPHSCDNLGQDRLVFSPCGDWLASVSHSDVIVCDTASGEFICLLNNKSSKLPTPPPVEQVAFFRDASRLASVDKDTLHVWDVKNGECIGVVDIGAFGYHGGKFAISADGSLLATSDGWSDVKLWSGDSLSLIDTFKFGKEWIKCLAISEEVLAIGFSETAELHDLKGRSIIAVFKANSTNLLAVSPDSTRLAGADRDDRVHLWEVPSIKASVPKSIKPSLITALAFSPDCSRLASGSDDGTIQLWDTTHPAHVISSQKIDFGSIATLAFSPDGERFASRLKYSTKSRIWDGKSGLSITLFDSPILHLSFYSPVAVSHHLLAVGINNAVHVWDCCTRSHTIHTRYYDSRSLSFSPDGSLLASTESNGLGLSISLWDAINGTTIRTFELEESYVTFRLAEPPIFSPDASKLAIVITGKHILIDLINVTVNQSPRHEDLPWVPGPPIPHPVTHIPRFFLERYESVPVLRLPDNVGISASAQGSSGIVALGCEGGQVFIVQLSTLTN